MSEGFIPISVSEPLKMAFLDVSDYGNAKRLVAVAEGKLLWVEDAKAFAFNDGPRWSLERGDMEAQRLAHQVIDHIRVEMETLGEIANDAGALQKRVGSWCTPEIAQERVKTLQGWAVKSGSAGATSGMLKQVRSFLTARLEDFDKDPLVYNCLNFTLRFVQVEGSWMVRHSPHDPVDMLMQVANVLYMPEAECPFWSERLAMLTPDLEQLGAFQLLYGYSLTGLTDDQAFYVHQGKGGDGKSATNMALANLHGDYYRHAGVKTFLQGKDGGAAEHRSDLFRLRGDIRFVTCDEPKARSIWDGETIKQITGSLVTARGANEKTEITYRPRFKLHTECNTIPRAPSDDKGFRRRFKVYQWRVSLDSTPEGEMHMTAVLARLEAENSGILNWLIEGALAWLTTRKIPQPAAMAEVLADFWADSSPLIEWMAEWCDTSDPGASESGKALHSHFKQWCLDAEIEETKIMTMTAFGRALSNKQFVGVKDPKGRRIRRGIRLRNAAYYDLGDGAGPLGADAGRSDRPAVAPPDDDDVMPL